MSDIVLSKNKFLCYFQIQHQQQHQIDQLLLPDTLVLSIYHHHYPSIYYPIIYNHFKVYFSTQITSNHIQLIINHQQMPSDLPIGLFAHNNCTIQVRTREHEVVDGFRQMMSSWKKGYTIVNREGGCDHIFKKLNQIQQRQLYNLHINGASHGLHKIPKYEGNSIAIKVFFEGMIIQRREQNLNFSIKEYLFILFDDNSFLSDKIILTHGIQIDLGLSLKQLLQEWNYNDGFCYLHIKK